MENKASVLVYLTPPLFADGVISAITASGQFEVIATPEKETEVMTLVRQLQPRVAIIGSHPLNTAIFRVVKEMKGASANMSILVLANKTTLPHVFQCLRCGATGYLLDTASKDELISALRAICAGEVVLAQHALDELTQQRSHAINEQADSSILQRLSSRELQALRLAGKGLTNKDIATKLFISERTVQTHFNAIFTKLGVRSRTEAVLRAWRDGLLSEEDLVD